MSNLSLPPPSCLVLLMIEYAQSQSLKYPARGKIFVQVPKPDPWHEDDGVDMGGAAVEDGHWKYADFAMKHGWFSRVMLVSVSLQEVTDFEYDVTKYRKSDDEPVTRNRLDQWLSFQHRFNIIIELGMTIVTVPGGVTGWKGVTTEWWLPQFQHHIQSAHDF